MSHLKNAIEILRDTREKLGKELESTPQLHLRADNVLTQLINIISHAAGTHAATPSVDEEKPEGERTYAMVLGKKIPLKTATTTEPVAAATPSVDEEKELDDFADLAYDAFKTDDARQLKSAYNDLIIRAVARKAGMSEVTSTTPAKVSLEFIRQIQSAINIKEKTTEPVAAATPELKIGDTVTTTQHEYPMLVKSIDGDAVECEYYVGEELKEDIYTKSELIIKNEEQTK